MLISLCQTDRSETSGTDQGKMKRRCSIETKFPTGQKRSRFQLLLRELKLETRIFENGTASFGRTGQTGPRGLPLEVDHFSRKISTWTEAFHLCFDRNFRKFWRNGNHPTKRWSVLQVYCQGQQDCEKFNLLHDEKGKTSVTLVVYTCTRMNTLHTDCRI